MHINPLSTHHYIFVKPECKSDRLYNKWKFRMTDSTISYILIEALQTLTFYPTESFAFSSLKHGLVHVHKNKQPVCRGGVGGEANKTIEINSFTHILSPSSSPSPTCAYVLPLNEFRQMIKYFSQLHI